MKYLCLSIFFVCSFYMYGQRSIYKSERLAPRWMSKLPDPANPSFMYVVITGEGSTLEEARKVGENRLASNEQLKATVTVTMDRNTTSNQYQQFNDGRLKERIDNYTTVVVNVHGKEIPLTANRIDEYWELVSIGGNRQYLCHALYAVATSSLPVLFDQVSLTTKYGMKGFIRSFIPGWGQMYKGSTAKGICFLGGEIALAGGIIVAENLRASYKKKMREQPQHAKTYNTKADNCANARNICIGAAAALYVYNLIDALVAPGSKRVVVHKQRYFTFHPVVSETYSGIGLAFNF